LYLNELRARQEDTVFLDGGNLLFKKALLNPTERQQLTGKASKIVEAYNVLGCDAFAVGRFEFAAGFEALKAYRKAAAFPFVCANLLDKQSGKPVFEPYVIVERSGVRIGILGVMDVGALDGAEASAGGMRIAPFYEVVRKTAAHLKKLGCDVVVVLSSIEQKKLRVLAKNTPDVNLFLAGDPNDNLTLPYRIDGALIASTSQLGKYLGQVEVRVDAGTRRVRDMKHAFIPMKPDRPEDPVVKRIVDSYYRGLALLKREQPAMYVREAEESVNLQYDKPVFVSAEVCRSCHPREYANWKETAHAQAFQSLPLEARSNMECLECHVTGFGKWGGFVSSGSKPSLEGVQCEECHGPGSSHPATMGMRKAKEAAGVCKRCHTKAQSPHFRAREFTARISCLRGH
jgi:hypothetical protein